MDTAAISGIWKRCKYAHIHNPYRHTYIYFDLFDIFNFCSNTLLHTVCHQIAWQRNKRRVVVLLLYTNNKPKCITHTRSHVLCILLVLILMVVYLVSYTYIAIANNHIVLYTALLLRLLLITLLGYFFSLFLTEYTPLSNYLKPFQFLHYFILCFCLFTVVV